MGRRSGAVAQYNRAKLGVKSPYKVPDSDFLDNLTIWILHWTRYDASSGESRAKIASVYTFLRKQRRFEALENMHF